MRITNQMMSNSFLRDMSNNMENLRTLQSQMTSGKEIRKPSDNPFKAARAMQLHTDINTNKQYNENIVDASNWLDITDTALGQAGDVIQRVRELLVSSGNASYGAGEKLAIKNEINEKIGELSQIMNTSFDGKYIFGGTRGTVKPVGDLIDSNGNTVINYIHRDGTPIDTLPDSELNMIKSKISTEISQGVLLEYNVTAGDVLEFSNEKGEKINLSELLKRVTNHLDGMDDNGLSTDPDATNKLIGKDLESITDTITNILKLRSEVGAKTNRMESAKSKNERENSSMIEILANTEDIDITQKTMEYATMQTVYIASLQTSAKIIQPSLMDYLR